MGPFVREGGRAPVKIRVLEILATLKRAGAESVAVSLARRLDGARFECGLVSLYDAFSDGFEPALVERGIAVWHLGKRRGFDPRMWPRLIRVLREFRPDVVHTHSYILRYTASRGPGGQNAGHGAFGAQPRARTTPDAFGRLVNRARLPRVVSCPWRSARP